MRNCCNFFFEDEKIILQLKLKLEKRLYYSLNENKKKAILRKNCMQEIARKVENI